MLAFVVVYPRIFHVLFLFCIDLSILIFWIFHINFFRFHLLSFPYIFVLNNFIHFDFVLELLVSFVPVILYFSNNVMFWFIMLSLLLLYSLICICEMSFILVLDMIVLCKYINFLSSMFHSLRNSPISPSSNGLGVKVGSFNIVLIMINCMSVSSLISSLLMYQVSHPYKSARNFVA